MFVIKNAWKGVTRNKGRNILIIVIVAIIAAAATISLSIRQAAATARASELENTTVTAQISLDRGKLISDSREQSKSDSDSSDSASSSKPDFDAMRNALADKQLSLADYQKYAKASSAVKSTYYTETTGLAATDDFQPVTDSTDSDSSGSSESFGRIYAAVWTGIVVPRVFQQCTGYSGMEHDDVVVGEKRGSRQIVV